MKKAVFLDRDGVINRLVINPIVDEYESPLHVDDFELYPWTLRSLRSLKEMGYMLFLISNQPGFAKGKTSLKNIKEIHDMLHTILMEHGVDFTEYYYCYHHPKGMVPEFSFECECRKPGTLFLRKAHEGFQFSIQDSWLIGDEDSDILCGKAYGLTTILIDEERSERKRGKSDPEFHATDLKDAVRIIKTEMIHNKCNSRLEIRR